ncbi:MAG: NYN domain-containing protein [Xanthomonadales bacterium]|nr:NYN domain-containing protein [Xanthomonadales bacterium]
MKQVAVFVDAGYLFAQGSQELFGEKLRRGELVLDERAVIQKLTEFAGAVSGRRLLRIYWYDGTSAGPTAQHASLAFLDNTKVRLGFVNSVGEQKGVDSLLVTDMITLARNRAMSDAVLLAGDEDLRVGVQQAQEFGVRVHLVGIRPARGSQSTFLLQEADTKVEWDGAQLGAFLSRRERVDASIVVAPVVATTGLLAEVEFGALLDELTESELQALITEFEQLRGVPRTIDARLLTIARAQLGRDLEQSEKRLLRERLVGGARDRVLKTP